MIIFIARFIQCKITKHLEKDTVFLKLLEPSNSYFLQQKQMEI